MLLGMEVILNHVNYHWIIVTHQWVIAVINTVKVF